MLKKILIALAVMASFMDTADACTGIVRKAENGDWVYARTMEFGADLISFNMSLVPRNIANKGQTPTGEPGFSWTNKYASVGFSPFNLPLLADGLNEKGLACGAFYLPGWAEYETVTPQEYAKTISNLDFVSWVLGNFSTVAEVRSGLSQIKVAGVELKDWGFIPPLHYIVVDADGNKLVVEYLKGKLNLYEAPLNTITNAPSYDWHLINARNYIGLRALNDPFVKINGTEFAQFGQGSGAIGLPGDFSPPARFIRAAFLTQVVLPAKKGQDEIKTAFIILNQFDIPRGAIHEKHNGKDFYDVTQWTSAADLKNLRYYFHTQENRAIRMVDLNKLDLNGKEIKSIAINNPEVIQDLSSNLR